VIADDYVTIVPFWIEKTLARNNCKLDTIFDYTKLRQFVALDDVISLLSLQDKFNIFNGRTLANDLLSSWQKTADAYGLSEIQNTVSPLSYSEDLDQENNQRLEPLDSSLKSDDESTVYYKLYAGMDRLFVIIYPGFRQYISKIENQYKVTVEQLLLFYSYMKCNEVSKLPVFRKYIFLLLARQSPKATV
jgi:hypothetical protein